jgi:hypothetical protein
MADKSADLQNVVLAAASKRPVILWKSGQSKRSEPCSSRVCGDTSEAIGLHVIWVVNAKVLRQCGNQTHIAFADVRTNRQLGCEPNGRHAPVPWRGAELSIAS